MAVLTKFPSVAAPEVFILTTSGTANDDIFVDMTEFPFQWCDLEGVGLVCIYMYDLTTLMKKKPIYGREQTICWITFHKSYRYYM